MRPLYFVVLAYGEQSHVLSFPVPRRDGELVACGAKFQKCSDSIVGESTQTIMPLFGGGVLLAAPHVVVLDVHRIQSCVA